MILTAGLLIAAAVLLWGRPQQRLPVLLARGNTRKPAQRGTPAGKPRAPGAEDAVTVIAQSAALLRIGATPHSCFAHLARAHEGDQLGPPLHRVARAIELGTRPQRAILHHTGALPAETAQVFEGLAAAWHVAETSGAALGDVLETLAQGARDGVDARRERDVALAGPRATVSVLSWLPLIGLGLGALIGADLLAVFTGSPWGAATMAGGTALLLLGRWWMNRMLTACSQPQAGGR